MLLGALIVILLVIGFKEGWLRALKIVGILFGIFIGGFFLGTVFNLDQGALNVFAILWLGGSVLWFIIHCLKEGYITNPNITRFR
jgi:hypothetical protein